MNLRFAAGIIAGLLALAAAPSAHAAAVTVHVEGGSGVVVPPTVVQTGAFTVTKDGQNSCTGTSAAGALELATGGDWSGEWSSGFSSYIARTIRGESYPASQNAYYWGFSVDGAPASSGLCGVELADGQEVLLYKACFEATSGCFDGTVLQLTASPGRVAPGAPVHVAVQQVTTTYGGPPDYAATTSRAPAAGVTVSGGGAAATTGADGTATLTPAGRGPVTLRATRDANVPDQADVCITDGGDGFCGTSTPAPVVTPCRTTGDDGFCGTPDRRAGFGVIRSLKEGQRFRRGRGPRELRGAVDDEAALAAVELRITGRRGRRCTTYDARRERMVRMKRCGASRGKWFSAGTTTEWRYLLPERLGTGRWVVDVRTRDRAGNRNQTLQRGRTRMVVRVG